jgi:DNA-binding PadR family transcriptional regulator
MTVPMAMLALLSERPTHGFDLKHRYDELLGHERELKYGQVYATLQRLERDGLANDVGVAPGAGADRRMYAITGAGVSELDQWLATPQVPLGRPAEIFTRVVLALVSGRPAEKILDAHRRVFIKRMRELTKRRATDDAIARLAADYEIAHLEADLKWIETAARRLKEAQAELAGSRGFETPLSGSSTDGQRRMTGAAK